MGVGRDHDDPGRGTGHQPVEQQVGQQDVAEVVDAEGGLEAVLGLGPLAQDEPGVVDQHVEAGVGREEVGGEGPDGRGGRQVEGHDLDGVGPGALHDLGPSRLTPGRVPGGDGDRGPQGGQGHGRLEAEAGVAAGDEHRLVLHAATVAIDVVTLTSRPEGVASALVGGQHHRGPDPLGGLHLGQDIGVLDPGVGPRAVRQVAHGQTGLGGAVPAVDHGVGDHGRRPVGRVGDRHRRMGARRGAPAARPGRAASPGRARCCRRRRRAWSGACPPRSPARRCPGRPAACRPSRRWRGSGSCCRPRRRRAGRRSRSRPRASSAARPRASQGEVDRRGEAASRGRGGRRRRRRGRRPAAPSAQTSAMAGDRQARRARPRRPGRSRSTSRAGRPAGRRAHPGASAASWLARTTGPGHVDVHDRHRVLGVRVADHPVLGGGVDQVLGRRARPGTRRTGWPPPPRSSAP